MKVFAYDCNLITFGTRKQFKRSFKTCPYCGEEFTAHNRKTIDHILARVNGGTNNITNEITVCEKCNRDKSGMSLRAYIEKHPSVEEYLKESVNEHAGQIYDNVEWSDGVKEKLLIEIGRDIFA